MRAEHGAELAAPHLAPAEVVGQPLGQPLGELAGPVRVGQVGDADVDLLPAGRLDRELLEPGQRPAEVRTFSSDATLPSSICSSGFTASAPPNSAAAAPIRPPRRRYSSVST